MTLKTEIRKEMKIKRHSLTEEQSAAAGERVLDRLVSLKEWKDSPSLYCYVSYHSELDTYPLMKKALEEKKRLFVPKVEGERLCFFEIWDLQKDLAPGAYGIPEPTTQAEDISHSGLFVLPGLAFDDKFHRLGYGGGFYDRYLKWPNTHFKVAVGYDFQLIEAVPCEAFDEPVDCIITENYFLRKD